MKNLMYLTVFLLSFVGRNSFAQMNMENQIYQLNRFRIDPVNRIVYNEKMIGGTEVSENGDVLHWDGIQIVPDQNIDYDKTSLIILGSFVTFREYFNSTCDLSALKVLRTKPGYNHYTYVLEGDKFLYTFYNSREIGKIDVSGYQHVTDCVFRHFTTGKYYFLEDEGYLKLTEATHIETLHHGSLKHVSGNYYMDKNGLYFFGEERSQYQDGQITYYNDSGLLEKNDGQIEPFVASGYLVYGQAVYSTKDGHRACKLELDGNKLNELDFNDNHRYITDGQKMYKVWGTSWSWEETTVEREFHTQEFTVKDLADWQIISVVVKAHNHSATEYYFPGKKRRDGSGRYFFLVSTPDGFYMVHKKSSLSSPEAVKQKKVMIYNYDIDTYEPLDITQFQSIKNPFYSYGKNYYIYRNRLHSPDLINTNINFTQMQFVSYRFINTNFLTDGTCLVHYNTLNKIDFADFKTLKVVNQDILIDEKYIYTYSDGLQAIPYKELGLDVIVITE